jgi:spore photoproduct lyase
MVVVRKRKSGFVKLSDKTPPTVRCPHFYELNLSNGCPYNCSYCYLKVTFRGHTQPTLFESGWETVKSEIEAVPEGVFVTGELADSLAVIPPLLPKVLDYFSEQEDKYLLLVTKSANIDLLLGRVASKQIVVSFSVNSVEAADSFEKGAPSPLKRLEAAESMIQRGWRVRLRLDPVILESGIAHYEPVCRKISSMNLERVTVGTLRQYPGLFRFAPDAPRVGLSRASSDGRMRYSVTERARAYQKIALWLGYQPSLCKEIDELWDILGWRFEGCNCTG